MLDTPVVQLSLIIGITYIVYRLKEGDYQICTYVDKPFVHLVILSAVIYLSQSYIALSIIFLFGYVMVIDECYIKKWEDAFTKINVNTEPVQKCTIKEVEPVYNTPHVDISVGEKHQEAFVGREYYSTHN